MLQIRNVTRGTSNERMVVINTKFSGSSGYPMYFSLAPNASIEVPRQNVHDWHPSVKQNLAELMAHGLVKVFNLDSSHLYLDKGNACAYSINYILPAAQGLALEHALEVAVSLDTAINGHVQSLVVHHAVTAVIGAAAPTDLASLLVWLVAAQTAYDAVHRVDIPAHPHLDLENTLVPVGPVDLPTSIDALRELHKAFMSHRTWVVGTGELDAATVAAY